MLNRIQKDIEETVEECYEKMSADFEQEGIVIPEGYDPIVKLPWQQMKFTEELKSKVFLFAEEFLKSKDVIDTFMKITKDTEDFCQKVSLELSDMESQWLDEATEYPSAVSRNEEYSYAGTGKQSLVQVLAAAGFALALRNPYAAIAMVAPFTVILTSALVKGKMKVNCKEAVRITIHKTLEDGVGIVLKKMVNTGMTLNLRRIESLKKMTEQLQESRKDILAKQGMLINLKLKVESMMRNAIKILDI